MKTIQYSKQADKALNAMPQNQAAKIEAKIDVLATNPAALANNIKALKGSNCLRLRVDNWRVVYTEDLVIISVLDIDQRKDIYR